LPDEATKVVVINDNGKLHYTHRRSRHSRICIAHKLAARGPAATMRLQMYHFALLAIGASPTKTESQYFHKTLAMRSFDWDCRDSNACRPGTVSRSFHRTRP